MLRRYPRVWYTDSDIRAEDLLWRQPNGGVPSREYRTGWSRSTFLSRFAVSFGLALLLSNVTAYGQVYIVTDLGVLPNADSSIATSINNHGQIVGRSHIVINPFNQFDRAFLWQNGQMTELGDLPGFSNTPNFATSINNNGQIVGCIGTCGDGARGFLWANGVMTEPWANQVPFNRIFGPVHISDTGQVVGVGEYFISTGREVVPISWKDGAVSTAFENGFCPGKCFAFLRAVNNLGHVVGEAVNIGGSGLTNKATLWRDGIATNVGLLPGSTASTATDINDGGEVVGNSVVNGAMPRAFAWKDGTIRDLGTLGGGTSTAVAINENGLIVGSAQNAAGASRAVLYSNGTVSDLNELILGTAGWELIAATDITNTGQIVGYGTFRAQTRAFLLTPVPSGVEPSMGGNVGSVTTTIGGQFVPGVEVRLSCPGQPEVIGTNLKLRTGGRVLTVTFDLRGTLPGVCDVVVSNPDGSRLMTLPDAFSIESGGRPEMWVDILGFDRIRPGRPQRFYIVYGNKGNVDAEQVGICIEASSSLGLSVVDINASVQLVPDSLTRNTYGLLTVPVIPPQESAVLIIDVMATAPTPGTKFVLTAWTSWSNTR